MNESNLEVYNQIVSKSGLPRKGKTMPYTSANGYMFSQLNKAGEIGIRFSEADQKSFMEKYNASEFRSYGAVMKGYVRIPDNLLSDIDLLSECLCNSYDYVCSLDSK